MDTSFGYLPSDEDDMQSLKEFRKTLRQNAMLIMDVFNRQQIISKQGAAGLKWVLLPLLLKLGRLGKWALFRFFRWWKYPSFFLLQKRSVDSGGWLLRDLWVVCDRADGQVRVFKHIARLYERNLLQEQLETAGFTVKHTYGDYEGQQFNPVSNRLILVATTKPVRS